MQRTNSSVAKYTTGTCPSSVQTTGADLGLIHAACEEFVERVGGFVLERGEHVGVSVEGDPDRGVSEPFGDHLGMDAFREHQGCMGVTEVVEPNGREFLLAQAVGSAGGEGVGVEWLAVAATRPLRRQGRSAV
jgi:hypothetical protein